MNVKEAAKLAGVSLRTLRYYEEQGLIRPERRDDNGYREYDRATIERVRMIRAYRALHFSLKEAQTLLDASRMERDAILQAQQAALEAQKRKLEHRIALIRGARMIGAGRLKELDLEVLDAQMDRAQRFLDENKDAELFAERFREKSREQQDKMQAELLERLGRIANAAEADVRGEISGLWDSIEENYYPCTDELLLAYGRSYGGDGTLAQLLDKKAGEGSSARLGTRIEKWYAEQKEKRG